MSRQDKTRKVILQLKAVKEERGISLQRIHDLTLANGGNVSFSTVRKVFLEGSENMNFRYEDTIQPIAAALLDTESEIEPTGIVETEAEALRALVRLKNSIISEYQDKIDTMEEREAEIKADAQRKIDHLIKESGRKDQLLDERADFLRLKDEQISGLRDEIAELKAENKKHTNSPELDKQKKISRRLFIALCVVTVLLIIALGSAPIFSLF